MILKSTVATFHKTQDNGSVTGLRKLLEMLQQAQDATDYKIRISRLSPILLNLDSNDFDLTRKMGNR